MVGCWKSGRTSVARDALSELARVAVPRELRDSAALRRPGIAGSERADQDTNALHRAVHETMTRRFEGQRT